MSEIVVTVAEEKHKQYSQKISEGYRESAKSRGIGIAKRSPAYLERKIEEGKAIIALHKKSGEFAGFCYIESWGHEQFVANSGLLVNPRFRGYGLGRRIKEKAFELSRKKFPKAKIFGLTTSLAVMKLNSELGYHPVPFSELTDDQEFWQGCSSCVNYEILKSKNYKNCFCTGMIFDPQSKKKKRWDFMKYLKLHERWLKLKRIMLLGSKSE